MAWTPQEKNRITTIENMLIRLIQYSDCYVHTSAEDIIKEFQPPLESVPKICEEDKDKQAERMLKAARKHMKQTLKKQTFAKLK